MISTAGSRDSISLGDLRFPGAAQWTIQAVVGPERRSRYAPCLSSAFLRSSPTAFQSAVNPSLGAFGLGSLSANNKLAALSPNRRPVVNDLPEFADFPASAMIRALVLVRMIKPSVAAEGYPTNRSGAL